MKSSPRSSWKWILSGCRQQVACPGLQCPSPDAPSCRLSRCCEVLAFSLVLLFAKWYSLKAATTFSWSCVSCVTGGGSSVKRSCAKMLSLNISNCFGLRFAGIQFTSAIVLVARKATVICSSMLFCVPISLDGKVVSFERELPPVNFNRESDVQGSLCANCVVVLLYS